MMLSNCILAHIHCLHMYDVQVFIILFFLFYPASYWQDGPLYEPSPVKNVFLLKGKLFLPVLLAFMESDIF